MNIMSCLLVILLAVCGVTAPPPDSNLFINATTDTLKPKFSEVSTQDNDGLNLQQGMDTLRFTSHTGDKENGEKTKIRKPYNEEFEIKESDNEMKKEFTLEGKEVEQDKCECYISVDNQSIKYFQGQLIQHGPYFVKFRLMFPNRTNLHYTDYVFQGQRWFWTYNTSAGPLPFISWDLDYAKLSFGLLDAKTINIPFVALKVTGSCNITLGSYDTSLLITNALRSLIDPAKEAEYNEFLKYRESYFCYLIVNHELRGTIRYFAAQYLLYPCSYIRYKCCKVYYNYSSEKYKYSCPNGNTPGVQHWSQTSDLPAILVILIVAFCPIPLFHYFAWISKRDLAVEDAFAPDDLVVVDDFQLVKEDDDWIYADGKQSPLTFYDFFSFEMFGMYDKYPILTSRLRRLIVILLAPILIIIKLVWYRQGIGKWSDNEKITVDDFIKVGTPMGFHALFVDPWNEYKTFVPCLGGALSICIMYYVLGLLFMVFPRCLKQVVEDGLPSTNLYIPSPLFFGCKEILTMSNVKVESEQLEAGYLKGASLMKCSFYLLFTKKFWIRVWRIQTRRMHCMCEHTSLLLCVVRVFIFPFYLILCIVEITACLIYYGLPFFFFLVVMVKGAIKSLRYLRDQSRVLSEIFRYKLFIAVGVLTVFVMVSLLAYTLSLGSFVSIWLIMHVIAMCFIAVIIYPSVSFGYLFFIVIILYFFIKQIRNFSDVYADLLSTAVKISRNMSEKPYHVALNDGCISITNIKCEALKCIEINGIALDENTMAMFLFNDENRKIKIREKNHIFGIPKDLFDFLVRKHRPVCKQVLNLLFRVSIMIAFVNITWSILSKYTSGPTSEISEVMHVIFIVVVGVIPQLIAIAFANSNSALVREIKEKKIEDSILEYWSR